MKTIDTETEISKRPAQPSALRKASRESLSSIVEQELRGAILRRRFKPGDRLRPAAAGTGTWDQRHSGS